jgi:hypothetical protein
MSNGSWNDVFNPKSRSEEFNPNMIFLARNIVLHILDEPGSGFYVKYDPVSAMAEVGIPQENFLAMAAKWVELKGKKITEARGGVGPISS